MSVEELCQTIFNRREEAVLRRISAYPRHNPIASDVGLCMRELVLQMTHWQERPLMTVERKIMADRGSLVEEAILRELSSLGISVRTDRLPFEIKDKHGRVVLRGKADGFIEWEKKTYPLEIKKINPMVFPRINSVSDFQRWWWMTRYPHQLSGYLYANNLEEGLFLLDDAQGRWKLLPFALDYAEMEKILQRCEQAVNHRDAGTLPDYHTDAEVCKKCWAFGRVCFPPLTTEGTILLTDPEFEAKLERREELLPAHKEYENLDEDVKKSVKGKDGVLVGRFLITGKEIIRHYKAQEERDLVTWKSNIITVDKTQEKNELD